MVNFKCELISQLWRVIEQLVGIAPPVYVWLNAYISKNQSFFLELQSSISHMY